MSVKLTILGSGSAVPTGTRGVSSQYLNFHERHILIDCGEGTQLQMRKFGVKFSRLKFICISHLHGDHYLGIFGLLSTMSLLGRTQKLVIIAPPELEELVRLQFKVSGVYLGYELEFLPLVCEEKSLLLEDNKMKLFAFPLKHRIPTYGFQFVEKEQASNLIKEMITEYSLSIEEIRALKTGQNIERENEILYAEEFLQKPSSPKSYAYCSDTMYLPQLENWLAGTTFLYHEATFTKKFEVQAKKTMHSTAEQAATIAKNTGVSTLLLGHYSARFHDTTPVLNEATSVFENSICVNDGDEFVISN